MGRERLGTIRHKWQSLKRAVGRMEESVPEGVLPPVSLLHLAGAELRALLASVAPPDDTGAEPILREVGACLVPFAEEGSFTKALCVLMRAAEGCDCEFEARDAAFSFLYIAKLSINLAARDALFPEDLVERGNAFLIERQRELSEVGLNINITPVRLEGFSLRREARERARHLAAAPPLSMSEPARELLNESFAATYFNGAEELVGAVAHLARESGLVLSGEAARTLGNLAEGVFLRAALLDGRAASFVFYRALRQMAGRLAHGGGDSSLLLPEDVFAACKGL